MKRKKTKPTSRIKAVVPAPEAPPAPPQDEPKKKKRGKKQQAQTASTETVQPATEVPKASKVTVPVPSVWRECGYMYLVLYQYDESVAYLDPTDGRLRKINTRIFLSGFTPMEEEQPVRFALNLIARACIGNFQSTLPIYRRLIAMALNKDELMKMKPAAFAREYGRIMKLDRVPTNLAPSSREAYVDALMKKLAEEGEVLNRQETEENAAVAMGGEKKEEGEAKSETTPPVAGAAKVADAPKSSTPVAADSKKAEGAAPGSEPNSEKGIGMAKKGKGGKKLSGAAAAKKKAGAENAKTVYPAVKKKNPFREGSKKAKCFDLFAKGGERGAVLSAMKKHGVTDATASTWLNIFRKV